MSERISASTRAREFLDSIVEGSPEQNSMLWFENAPYVVRLVAFIKLDVSATYKSLQTPKTDKNPIQIRHLPTDD